MTLLKIGYGLSHAYDFCIGPDKSVLDLFL